jgi:hypothetical protein
MLRLPASFINLHPYQSLPVYFKSTEEATPGSELRGDRASWR